MPIENHLTRTTEKLLDKGSSKFSIEKLGVLAALHATLGRERVDDDYLNSLFQKLLELDRPNTQSEEIKSASLPSFFKFGAIPERPRA